MKTLIILGILGLLMLGNFIFSDNQTIESSEEPIYQGPVRPQDDESYFRKTGITRTLEVEE